MLSGKLTHDFQSSWKLIRKRFQKFTNSHVFEDFRWVWRAFGSFRSKVKGPSQTAAESSGGVESASQNTRRQVFSLFLHMTLHRLKHSLVRAHVYRHIIDRIAHISPWNRPKTLFWTTFFQFLKFLKKSNFEKILGGTNFLENQKTGRESTGNFLICLQFKFYQNRLKIKKVRAGNVTGRTRRVPPTSQHSERLL